MDGRYDKNHPWADFLYHRMRCIRWLRSEGRTPAEIAAELSMDETQVKLLQETLDRFPEAYQS